MENKKVVRLTESQLHNIIAESVSQILKEFDYDNPRVSKRKGWNEPAKKRPERFNGDKYWEDEPNPNLKDGDYFTEGIDEAYNRVQYANLAGQADGALNTFGGKLRGIFDKEWKQRKERQRNEFGNAAIGVASRNNLMDNDDITTYSSKMPNTPYEVDNYCHSFNSKANTSHVNDPSKYEEPFTIERNQFTEPRYGLRNTVYGGAHGTEKSIKDFNDMRYERNRTERGRFDGEDGERRDSGFAYTHRQLNNAYKNGKLNAMGKMKGTETDRMGNNLTGTGTKNGRFKRDGLGNK